MTNRRRQSERVLLSIGQIKGTVGWKGNSANVSWSIQVNDQGRVAIRFHTVTLTQSTAWMLHVMTEKGRFVTWAAIDGIAPDGRRVRSDYVTFTAHRWQMGTRTKVKLFAEASRLTVTWEKLPKTNRGLRAMYLVVGMQGFDVISTRTRAGQVFVSGSHEIDSFDRITGQIDVVADSPSVATPQWLQRCDDTVQRALQLISLANGRLTLWSIRHVAHDDIGDQKRIISTEFYGPKRTGQPHDGAGHFLNLQPWLDMVATRYTKALRRRTGIDVAIEWLLFHPTYPEFELLGAMTALEHLVSVYSSGRRGPGLVNHRTFAAVRRRFETHLATLSRQCQGGRNTVRMERLTLLLNSLRGSNRAPFRERLYSMLSAYRVPLSSIDTSIPRAIAARNSVVHRGKFGGDDSFRELYGHVVVLRELLKRTILALLQYSGSYHSTLNGSQHVLFPPS